MEINEDVTSVQNAEGITITSEKFTPDKIHHLLQEVGVSADILRISAFSYIIDIRVRG